MIENVYGIEPHGTDDDPSPVGGTVAVQYDSNGNDVGIGITLNRVGLEKYLADNPFYGQPDEPPLVLFVRMERSATNRLIRLLRKARDAAFGRDE